MHPDQHPPHNKARGKKGAKSVQKAKCEANRENFQVTQLIIQRKEPEKNEKLSKKNRGILLLKKKKKKSTENKRPVRQPETKKQDAAGRQGENGKQAKKLEWKTG